jgi:hypothetical protein
MYSYRIWSKTGAQRIWANPPMAAKSGTSRLTRRSATPARGSRSPLPSVTSTTTAWSISRCSTPHGNAHRRTSITLVQEGDDVPAGSHAVWMPYQLAIVLIDFVLFLLGTRKKTSFRPTPLARREGLLQ